jgi:OOP family OmpA-OmpF porin
MRKHLAPFLSALVMVGAVVGCQASVEVGAKKPEPEPAAQPAPPPTVAPAPAPAAEAPKPEPSFKVENGRLELPGPVVFETGSDKLKPESDAVLQVVADYLAAKKDITLMRVEGHTDNDGKPDANMELSQKRSMAVARWLVGKGIDCKRVIPVGFGQDKPIADNKTPEGKAQNRRTYFVNAQFKGKAVGGMPVDGGGKPAGDPCK